MRISIFGAGYVGTVSSACLAALGHEVVAVDVSSDKIDLINQGRSPVVEDEIDSLVAQGVGRGKLTATMDVATAITRTEVSFISVGTPSAPDGRVSMKAVEEVVATIGRALRDKPGTHAIVMRSTVPPGTAETCTIPILERESGRKFGEGFTYYSNPEFLREGSSVKDFYAPPFTLIGAPIDDDAASDARHLCTPPGTCSRSAFPCRGKRQVFGECLSCRETCLCQRGRRHSRRARG